jgi:hypothetical protein
MWRLSPGCLCIASLFSGIFHAEPHGNLHQEMMLLFVPTTYLGGCVDQDRSSEPVDFVWVCLLLAQKFLRLSNVVHNQKCATVSPSLSGELKICI